MTNFSSENQSWRTISGRARPLAALGLLLATAGAAQAQTPASFAPLATYPTGGSISLRVVTGDLNGDGRLDAVTVNITSNNVSVFLGNGAGAFGTATRYAVAPDGTQVQGLALVDVNADGKLDIVTANNGNSTVSVLLGQAGGTFGAYASYSTGPNTEPRNAAVGDVNGDGRLDIVTGNSGTATASVLLGLAGGGFGTPALYTTGGLAFDVALGDVNADGQLDIVTPAYNTDQVSVLPGRAGGTFGTFVKYGTGTNAQPTGVRLGDVNADGRLDIVVGNQNTTISVLLGQAGGTLAAPVAYATTGITNVYAISVGDVNGDSRPDLVVGNLSGSLIGVFLGQASGFGSIATFNGGNGPQGITLGDVNADGRPDILTANRNDNTLGVLLNTSVFAAPTLTSLTPTSGPVGTSVTLTGTNLGSATGVSFNGTAATFSVVNATTITATVPTGATTGNVTVTAGGGTSNGLAFTVAYADLVITTTTTIPAGTYNSITVNSPGNATLAGPVTVNTRTLVNNGATLNDGCNVLSGAGSFVLAAGGTLGICNAAGISSSGATGAIQNTGTRSFASDASYVYNGTAAQTTGSGLPGQVRNLTTTNDNPVTLSAATSVAQVLAVAGAGNLATGGRALTLLSGSAGTALIVNSGSGVVSGSATIQRYIDPSLNASTTANPGGKGYRHYSSPVQNTTVADLATAGFAPVLTQGYNTSATPGLTTPFPNVFSYDQSRLATVSSNYSAFDKGWVVPAAASTPLAVGQGYAVNIAGTELVDFVGSPNNGDLTVSLSRNAGATAADAGWNLVGNPYPAPLDYAQLNIGDFTNVDRAMYVFESTGQYAGSYRSYVNNNTSLPPVRLTADAALLAVGQGFFVRVSQGQTSGSLGFRNAQRVTSYADQAAFRRTAADTRPSVRLTLAGAGLADAFVAYAEAGATSAFDRDFDAAKLPNPTGLNLSSAVPTDNLAIDGRPAFTAATVLPLCVGVPAAGQYTLAAASLANLPAGLTAYLHDAATGQLTPLAAGTSYSFSMSAAEAATLRTGRFTLQFSATTPLATAASLLASEVTVYPNPAQGRFVVLVPAVAGASQVQAELLNTLGQVVRRQSAALPAAGATLTVEAAGLAAGVYTLRLTAGASTLAKRVVLH